MRDPFKSLADVGGIEKPVGIYGFMVRIREKREIYLAFPILGDLFGETNAFFRRIDADRVNDYFLVGL